jgi:hypothetical protein
MFWPELSKECRSVEPLLSSPLLFLSSECLYLISSFHNYVNYEGNVRVNLSWCREGPEQEQIKKKPLLSSRNDALLLIWKLIFISSLSGYKQEVLDQLASKKISIRVASPKLVMEEAPEAYKDVTEVISELSTFSLLSFNCALTLTLFLTLILTHINRSCEGCQHVSRGRHFQESDKAPTNCGR